METLEELYGLKKHEVKLERVKTKSGKWLETFPNPSPWGETECSEKYWVEIIFPEFTCLCPKTSQPDFAKLTITYDPDAVCVELKSLKYYLNSFRNEGHFHEQVTNLIASDLWELLNPYMLGVKGEFNVRGGTYPKITVLKER